MTRFRALTYFFTAAGILALTAFGLGQTPQGPPAQPGQARTGTAVIAGQVLDGNGQPVTDALVSLGRGGGAADRVVVDPRGRFVFRNVPAGAFGVVATRPGYLGGGVEQHEPTSAARPIEIADGQSLTDLTLRLWRGGAIDGTVLGEAGEPLANVEMQALRRSLIGGHWLLAPGPVTTTDDRGRYRFDTLTPGSYVVVARPDRDPETALLLAMLSANPLVAADVMAAAVTTTGARPEPDERVRNYAMTFYPAAPTSKDATLISVGPDSAHTKTDFRLKLSKVARVSGTISEHVDGVTLQLLPVSADGTPAAIESAVTACDEEGGFEFSGVTPGRYLIKVQSTAPPPLQGAPPQGPPPQGPPPQGPALFMAPVFSGSVTIDVGASDVTNVTVPVRKGVVVSGRIMFAGAAARPAPNQLAQIALRLDPVDQPAPAAPNAAWRGQIDPDGQFRTVSLPPGEYMLRLGAPPRGWTPLSATSGGRDIFDVPLTVGTSDITDVTIAFGDAPLASATGTVHDAQGASAPGASVVVFPADRALWRDTSPQSRRLRLMRGTTSGRFGAPNLPPGEYFVAAIDGELPGEWQDPARLEALSRIATRVPLQPGPPAPIELQISAAPAFSAAATPSEKRVSASPAAARPSARPSTSPARAKPGAAISIDAAYSGSVAGTVIDRATRRPAANATVLIAGADVGLLHVTTTDERGLFTFSGLPAGRFLVGAGKSAYLPAVHGANRPGRPGTLLSVDAGQHVTGLALSLTHGGVIAGRVTDDRDRPVPGARVRVVQHRAAGGEVAMNGDAGSPVVVTTDDRGGYRVFDLPPGEYAVLVQARGLVGGDVRRLTEADVDAAAPTPSTSTPPQANGMAMGWSPAYAPATMIPAEAIAVTIGAAEVRADVNVRTGLARFVRVEGTVTSADRTGTQNLQVALRPKGLTASGAILTNLTTRPSPDGRFNFPNVPPGDYTILARTLPPPIQPQDQPLPGQPQNAFPVQWALADVSVHEENITDVALELRAAVRVSGEVKIEGLSRLPADMPLIRVGVRPAQANIVQNSPPPVLLDKDGRFAIDGLVPGRYRIFLQIPNNDVLQVPAWFAKTAVTGDANPIDALDVAIDVGPAGAPDMIVTLTDTTQEIDGVVRDDAGAPLRDCTVVVFPTDRAFWFQQSRRIVTRQSTRDGKFVFGIAAGLPAGEYFVAAVPDGRPNEQLDVLLLSELAKTAARVTLNADETKTVTLTAKK